MSEPTLTDIADTLILRPSEADVVRKAAMRIAALEADNTALRSALLPFAEWSRKLDAEFGDHADDIIAGGIGGGLSITFGDLRAARAALKANKSEDEKT